MCDKGVVVMIDPMDVGPLTEFKRNTAAELKRLRKSGRPRLLTVNGKPALIVQDPASYQKMHARAEVQENLAAIRLAVEAFERGEGNPAREALTDALRRAKQAHKRSNRRAA
jgi:alcohol dehydrogenase class IV